MVAFAKAAAAVAGRNVRNDRAGHRFHLAP
jgi:hypothetical protein